MNERIRQLAEQATECYSNGQERTFDKEKFAELIVREMLVTCEEHPAWTGRMIGEQIKQHFGVEL
jgi:metal-sulfur cluster biosynthetic enzyme